MRKLSLCAAAAALALSGCAQMQEAGFDAKTANATGGAALGCLFGAVAAKATGGNAAVGCAAGAVVGGIAGFEKARSEEIAAAEQARQEAVAAIQRMPAAGKAPVHSEVRTVPVEVTDKASHQKKTLQTFDSVTVDIPVATRGMEEHDAAMAKLRALAERVADERGSCDITVATAPANAKARQVTAKSQQVLSKDGHKPITLVDVADPTVPAGVERVTVKAGKLPSEV